MSLYPLRLTYGEGTLATTFVITPGNWKYATPADRSRFESMPVADRLNLRRQLEVQVALARTTPTKGDRNA
jgi:hypothetical protein